MRTSLIAAFLLTAATPVFAADEKPAAPEFAPLPADKMIHQSAMIAGKAVAYDVTVGTVAGEGILAGFILTDQPVSGTADFGAPIFDHGRVKVAKVPFAAFVAPIPAKSATTIVFN